MLRVPKRYKKIKKYYAQYLEGPGTHNGRDSLGHHFKSKLLTKLHVKTHFMSKLFKSKLFMSKLQTNHFTRRLIEAYVLWQRTWLRKNWLSCKMRPWEWAKQFQTCNFQLSIQLSTISNKKLRTSWDPKSTHSFQLIQLSICQLWWKGGKVIKNH